MKNNTLEEFVTLIRGQFREETREDITPFTNLKQLKEWSSLQSMIVVNEIDKQYDVILSFDDLKEANSVEQLFHIVSSKRN